MSTGLHMYLDEKYEIVSASKRRCYMSSLQICHNIHIFTATSCNRGLVTDASTSVKTFFAPFDANTKMKPCE